MSLKVRQNYLIHYVLPSQADGLRANTVPGYAVNIQFVPTWSGVGVCNPYLHSTYGGSYRLDLKALLQATLERQPEPVRVRMGKYGR